MKLLIPRYKTKVAQDGNRIVVTFWNTQIFEFSKEPPYVILNSGGWRTATTKRRMNQCLRSVGLNNIRVFQKDFEWFVSTPQGDFEFFDGMRFELVKEIVL